MDANTERMPGDAEADAAIRGIVDLYGRSLTKGQEVAFRRDDWPAGQTEEGRIVDFHRGRILIETSDDVVEVEADELLP
jgi:hypothetical protein